MITITSVLDTAGVEGTTAADLAALVRDACAGTIDAGELEGASEARIALLAGIIAAGNPKFVDALPVILQFAAAHSKEFSDYDLGRLWHLKGFVAWKQQGSLYAATQSLNQSLSLLRQADSVAARCYLARVLDTFGQVMADQGLYKEARADYKLALDYRQWDPDEYGKAITLGNLGRACMGLGDFGDARGFLQQDLEILERIAPHRTRLRAQVLSHLGTCALELGEPQKAIELFEVSEKVAATAGDSAGVVFAVIGYARAALLEQELKTAARHADRAESLLIAGDIPGFAKDSLKGLVRQLQAELFHRRGDSDRALESYQQAREVLFSNPHFTPVERAQLLHGYALASRAANQPDQASLLLREALQALDATSATALRKEIDQELHAGSHDSWVLHSAGRYMGHQNMAFLLREGGQDGFIGATKKVAVLFSDIRGFTSISERFTAKELINFLNDYLTHMNRCVEYAGGMVDKFIGDAVMALFSLPDPHQDDAERAAIAALMMRCELARFNRSLQEAPGEMEPLENGIGLHFGELVAGLIGSPQKRSYTVIGDTVNTASRLEGMTKQLGASILASRELVSRLAEPRRFLLRPLGRYRPKGRDATVEVFDLMGEDDSSHFSEAIKDECRQAAEALTYFQNREFIDAYALFRKLARETQNTPRSKGYRLLAHRSHVYEDEAPLPGWDGSVTLTEK